MQETRRLLQAAAALSAALAAQSIPHAFHGSVLTAALAGTPLADEIFCIVEGGPPHAHPFRRARDALAAEPDFTATHSPWTNRCIEILPAGEAGPRHLDAATVMQVQGVPFLTVSEFIRAKLKAWAIRGAERDAQDIAYVLVRFWNRVDINRVPEADMALFVARNPTAAPAWAAVRRKYGM
ncbi:hypothetical protein HYPSUDRAFT_132377 [Hypholoma sublateritium FD-334 SS-4]|uniref:Uncharacterized protein n=1 Tax=Hypholoma sublateritium (strain FD-334 SS-4) TaxID=945553 RepID=A0A0D2PE44_HYPSF|nr:hypothetical protein HYPSUDRAFT_132377 [Hypholoma sublateritium FD-334 SS-4]